MSNHDLRFLRTNGVEDLYSILPPGVSPSHLPLPLLNQLQQAAGVPVQAPVPNPLAPHLLPPKQGAKTSKSSRNTPSKAELEKQLLLQQQQLLHLNAVYAQYFQGLSQSVPPELRGSLTPEGLVPGVLPATSVPYGPLADMQRQLFLAQNEKLKHSEQQQQKAEQLSRTFKGAGSAFTPVTPKQKTLNGLPMPKTSTAPRSASVPLATSTSAAVPIPWDPKLQLSKSDVSKSEAEVVKSTVIQSLVRTPEIQQKEVVETKEENDVVVTPKPVVETKVQVNEADSISSPTPKVPEVTTDKPEVVVTPKIAEKVPEKEEPVTTTSDLVEEKCPENESEKQPDKSEELLQSKEVSSSNIPVVSPKPSATQLPDQMQPLKKRRLKAVIADALNQNLDESYSSNYSSRNISPVQATSDSDTLPLAIIRDRLNESASIVKSNHECKITPMKLRAEDHITDIESSLKTFKSHVSTPKSSTPSSPVSRGDGPHGKSPLATPEKKKTGSSRRKVREPSASIPASPPVTYSTMDASEMQQLAPYIISGSDSDSNAESSGDDFHSRAYVDASERRKTRSPGTTPNSKPNKKVVPKKPGRKSTGKKKWKSEDEEEDDHLAKFFAADAELEDTVENRVSISKIRPTKKVAKKRKVEEAPKEQSARKRKSGTPRKLEVIDESKLDTWETAADTEIVKNSANHSDYLIKEHDASWYSVTCFCGQPFHGRPMIECDLCGMWVHMTCAKIKKNKVPENYNCTQCRRDAKAVKTRHRR